MSFIYDCGAQSSLFERGELGWRKSPRAQVSPTKVICRAGSSASMGYHSRGLPPKTAGIFTIGRLLLSYMAINAELELAIGEPQNGRSSYKSIEQTHSAVGWPSFNTGRHALRRCHRHLGEAVCRPAARRGALSNTGRCAIDYSSCAPMWPSFVGARWRP